MNSPASPVVGVSPGDPDAAGAAPAVFCVLLAIFLAALGQMVVVAAMPVITSALGEFDRYAWPTVSYLVASAVAMPVAGRVCDLYGCRATLAWGLIVFIAGCLAVSCAGTMTQLIALRVVEGFGAGLVLAAAYVSAVDLFPPRRRGVFQGLIGIVYGAALLIGPIAGGAVAEHLGWRWIFRMMAPLAVAVLLLVLRLYPVAGAQRGHARLDVPGVVLLILVAVPLLLALTTGGTVFGWESWQIRSLLGGGVAAAVAFVWFEARADAPLMPMTLYRDRTMAVAAVATGLTGFALYGSAFFLPLLLHASMRVSVTTSGAFVGTMMLAFVLGAVVAGMLLSRTRLRYRALILASAACMLTGMALLATTSTLEAGLLRGAACALVAGLGMGAMLAVLTVVVQNTSPAATAGSATAALQFYRLLGGLGGLAVMGAAISRGFRARLDAGSGHAFPEPLVQSIARDPALLIDPTHGAAIRQTLLAHVDEGAVAGLIDAMLRALGGAVHDALLWCLAALALCGAVCLLLPEPPAPGHGDSGR